MSRVNKYTLQKQIHELAENHLKTEGEKRKKSIIDELLNKQTVSPK